MEGKKKDFLLEKSKGDRSKLHQNHDLFAPLLNRRLEYDYVKRVLEENGFTDVTRTANTTEIYIRATKGQMKQEDKEMLLSPPGETLVSTIRLRSRATKGQIKQEERQCAESAVEALVVAIQLLADILKVRFLQIP